MFYFLKLLNMLFINRKNELELLKNRLDIFKNSIWQNTYHLAFLWLRRTGKTYLVKYFYSQVLNNYKDINIIFVDISKLTESIIYFCEYIIDEIIKSYNPINTDKETFFYNLKDDKIFSQYNIYSKQTDNTKIFDEFLKLLTLISNYKKLIIIFDEFQDILEFTKIKWLKNIDSIFRSELQNQLNIFYIITGSYPTILRNLIQNPKKKLYSHFDIYDIKNFDKNSSIELINQFWKDLANAEKIALYKACNWNPYLISLIIQKTDKNLLWDLEQNLKNLLFDKKWALYNHYEYILEESLSKIQNSIVLKWILKEISLSYWLSLSEISKKLWYSPQQILFWIKQLQKIDLIYQNDEKKWKFQDVLFAYFVAYSYSWIENYEFERNAYYLNEVNKLQEKLNKALQELGKTKEFELYYEIKHNQWNLWKGIKLPLFKKIQKNYFTSFWDEIDLYCETIKWKKWIFELKYKSKAIWNKEIEKFISKMEADKYIYISKSWFSEKIDEKYIKDKRIVLLNL